MIKVSQGCILKLLLHSVNSELILYRTGNMQSAILSSFVASSSLRPCGLQFTHLPMSCYIGPYIVYKVYGLNGLISNNYRMLAWYEVTENYILMHNSRLHAKYQ